ncbi:MAG: 6,7-dimethyl-8-ribityllumazine synthase [Proteobacteria bacterium]|nr:6,7-dimethyl-8-ribityllumazine synthase [Pseudomonadota bacterium]MCH8221133.1 6,7-dimethyl-8-ribityllumazine synthase [Pseudomonadota bacterium]
MQNIKTIRGDLNASDLRVAIVAARFNELVVESLIKGALDTLRSHGASDRNITLVRVPGAIEMGLALEKTAAGRQYDAIVALAAVIRGATPHFDYVAGECVQAVGQVSTRHGVPIGFGILTVDTIEQALERAGTKAGNKGSDAALAAIEMASLLRKLEG